MNMKKIITLLLILINLSLLLSGCAGGKVPQTGPTMAEVYERAMQQQNGDSLNNVRSGVSYSSLPTYTRLSGYTRTAQNEIDNLFHQLPNPPIVMYVYPHLAGSNRVPVPGYSTVFPMFEKTYYAMPGEV